MRNLTNLYLKCFLNKRNIIIIAICLFIMIISSLFSIDMGLSFEEFYLRKNEYLKSYIYNISLIIFLINSILIPLLASDITKEEHQTLHNILKPICGERKLFVSKILSFIEIIFYIVLIEFIIIVLMPMLVYPSVNFTLACFINIFILFLYSIFNVIVVYLIMEKIKSLLVCVIPIMIFLIFQNIGKYIKVFSIEYFFDFQRISIYNFLYLVIFLSLNLFIFWLRYATINKRVKSVKKIKKNIDFNRE